MRLTLVISSLQSGGAERILSLLANHWCSRGHTVTLITLADSATDFYPLHESIQRVALNLLVRSSSPLDALRNNWRRVWHLRQALRQSQPDLVISFVDRTNILTLLAGRGFPIIISERIDPRYHHIGSIWVILRKFLYPSAAVVVVQTEAVRLWMQPYNRHIYVIPNPVIVSSEKHTYAKNNPQTLPPGFNIVGMGRLAHQKGFDMLLRAFARCMRHDLYLTILGEGGERAALEKLAEELGITESLSLPGVITHPYALLAQADIFVLPSRYEGFPNALLEAMACGCAVIAADCPSGPGDIIRDGVDGMLIPPENVDALADALQDLIIAVDKRQRLGHHAKTVMERFSVETVLQQWDSVFDAVGKKT